jgi:hypothetical protein
MGEMTGGKHGQQVHVYLDDGDWNRKRAIGESVMKKGKPGII